MSDIGYPKKRESLTRLPFLSVRPYYGLNQYETFRRNVLFG